MVDVAPNKTRLKIKLGGRVIKPDGAAAAALQDLQQTVLAIAKRVDTLGVPTALDPLPSSWEVYGRPPPQRRAERPADERGVKRPRDEHPVNRDAEQPVARRPANPSTDPELKRRRTTPPREEGQLDSALDVLTYMSRLQQAPPLSGDYKAAVRQGQEHKRYSDAAVKRNRNKASAAALMFLLQSALAFLEAALLAQASKQRSSDIVTMLQQTLVLLETGLAKEDASMPELQQTAFKLVTRRLMTALAMRITLIGRAGAKDAAKQLLASSSSYNKASPDDSNVSSETSHAGRHEWATKCAESALVQARVVEYASLAAPLQAAFVAHVHKAPARCQEAAAALAVAAQLLGGDTAAGSAEVLLHVAKQGVQALEGLVKAMG